MHYINDYCSKCAALKVFHPSFDIYIMLENTFGIDNIDIANLCKVVGQNSSTDVKLQMAF